MMSLIPKKALHAIMILACFAHPFTSRDTFTRSIMWETLINTFFTYDAFLAVNSVPFLCSFPVLRILYQTMLGDDLGGQACCPPRSRSRDPILSI